MELGGRAENDASARREQNRKTNRMPLTAPHEGREDPTAARGFALLDRRGRCIPRHCAARALMAMLAGAVVYERRGATQHGGCCWSADSVVWRGVARCAVQGFQRAQFREAGCCTTARWHASWQSHRPCVRGQVSGAETKDWGKLGRALSLSAQRRTRAGWTAPLAKQWRAPRQSSQPTRTGS
jgi:hypothetical protein